MTKRIEFVVNETKWEKFKRKASEGYTKVRDWTIDHAEVVVTMTTVVVIGANKIVKSITSTSNLRRRERLQKYSVYDRPENHHWLLKRTLSNAEWKEVSYRKKAGERLGDILESMKVLK